MLKFLLAVLVLILSLSVGSTTFIPVSIEKQIESSSSAAIVELTGSKTYKNQENRITTEYVFKIINYFGSTENFENKTELRFSLPGGSLNGVRTVVADAPEFKKNVPVFVLLKEVDSKIFLSNFTMGKFNLVNIQGEEYFVNDVYPKMENVGRVKKSKMMKLVQSAWGSRIVDQVPKNIIPVVKLAENNIRHEQLKNKVKFEKREPASVEENGFSLPQVIIYIFALLGILIALIILRKDKNEGE